MTARDPRLASHSLRDDERPSPRRPITMPRELWARIDAARGEQSCAEWLRAAALAKLDGHADSLFVELEAAARLLVERLTTGGLTPARRLAAVRRDLPALVEILRELDQARGWPVRDPTLGEGVDVEPAGLDHAEALARLCALSLDREQAERWLGRARGLAPGPNGARDNALREIVREHLAYLAAAR